MTNKEWPLWEVFIRSKAGLDHKHAGSLHAADVQMAIENARDVYTRRMEGVSIWVVESKYIHASDPSESDSMSYILRFTRRAQAHVVELIIVSQPTNNS